MQVSEYGPHVFYVDDPDALPGQARTIWFRGSGFQDSLLLLVNKRLVTKVILDVDKQLLTVELPSDLFVEGQRLHIALIDTVSDERTPGMFVPVRRRGTMSGHGTTPQGMLGPKGDHLLISCFPKSGSTLLLQLLCHATGYVSRPFVFEYGGNEQDLYVPAILDAYPYNTITQQHVRATRTNLKLINNFGLKVVVLTRNIYDTLASLHDHLLSESLEIPMAYVDESFTKKTTEERMDYLVDIVTPWYLNFYASWSNAMTLLPDGKVIRMSYEDLIRDKTAEVSRIVTHFRLKNVERSGDTTQPGENHARFNVGISGRGKQVLNAVQQNRICNLVRQYHNVDFSPILE